MFKNLQSKEQMSRFRSSQAYDSSGPPHITPNSPTKSDTILPQKRKLFIQSSLSPTRSFTQPPTNEFNNDNDDTIFEEFNFNEFNDRHLNDENLLADPKLLDIPIIETNLEIKHTLSTGPRASLRVYAAKPLNSTITTPPQSYDGVMEVQPTTYTTNSSQSSQKIVESSQPPILKQRPDFSNIFESNRFNLRSATGTPTNLNQFLDRTLSSDNTFGKTHTNQTKQTSSHLDSSSKIIQKLIPNESASNPLLLNDDALSNSISRPEIIPFQSLPNNLKDVNSMICPHESPMSQASTLNQPTYKRPLPQFNGIAQSINKISSAITLPYNRVNSSDRKFSGPAGNLPQLVIN